MGLLSQLSTNMTCDILGQARKIAQDKGIDPKNLECSGCDGNPRHCPFVVNPELARADGALQVQKFNDRLQFVKS
jgi:hypothetical protein